MYSPDFYVFKPFTVVCSMPHVLVLLVFHVFRQHVCLGVCVCLCVTHGLTYIKATFQTFHQTLWLSFVAAKLAICFFVLLSYVSCYTPFNMSYTTSLVAIIRIMHQHKHPLHVNNFSSIF